MWWQDTSIISLFVWYLSFLLCLDDIMKYNDKILPCFQYLCHIYVSFLLSLDLFTGCWSVCDGQKPTSSRGSHHLYGGHHRHWWFRIPDPGDQLHPGHRGTGKVPQSVVSQGQTWSLREQNQPGATSEGMRTCTVWSLTWVTVV